jgi:hypothetical protein
VLPRTDVSFGIQLSRDLQQERHAVCRAGASRYGLGMSRHPCLVSAADGPSLDRTVCAARSCGLSHSTSIRPVIANALVSNVVLVYDTKLIHDVQAIHLRPVADSRGYRLSIRARNTSASINLPSIWAASVTRHWLFRRQSSSNRHSTHRGRT